MVWLQMEPENPNNNVVHKNYWKVKNYVVSIGGLSASHIIANTKKKQNVMCFLALKRCVMIIIIYFRLPLFIT